MPLHLAIENETSLPDGGPTDVTVTSKRGIDIGRDQYLDWVLPDPTRFISGKHCEIRYREGGYWITDVSTNGTFINRSEFRLDRPHQLQSGDQIEIGRYVIMVVVEPEADAAVQPASELPPPGDPNASLWSVGDTAAPAINPRELRTPIVSPGIGGFSVLDWAADIPAVHTPIEPQFTPAPSPASEPDWMSELRPDPAPPAPFEDTPPLAAEPMAAAAPIGPPPAAPPADLPYMAMSGPNQNGSRATFPQQGTRSDFVERFAKGLGLPKDAISVSDEGEFAELLGALLLSTVENMRQLHLARVQSKGMMRSSNQTMIQPTDNNPLRFSPTAEDALRIMFGPRTSSYMEPRKALDSSFSDLKKHQLAIFGAMQQAVGKLIEDFDPKKIEAIIDAKGSGGLLNSKKGRMWDHFATVWQAKAGSREMGMLAVFMQLFADAYDSNR